ncbi:hypothetical protein [Xanthomonas sacchari]|uniref:hypothetical protein n=1 Tax=Xanthomonas sacchari TaxID=56458 RepID=UPI00352877EC
MNDEARPSQRSTNNKSSSVTTTDATHGLDSSMSRQDDKTDPGLAGTLPSSISEKNMKRVVAMRNDLIGSSDFYKDIYDLYSAEGKDEKWSPSMEANIDTHLRSKGRGYDGLEVSEPSCSKTICYISTVVKPNTSPKAANADWQTLMTSAYGEQWFRDNFADAHIVQGGDNNGTIYISFFQRK